MFNGEQILFFVLGILTMIFVAVLIRSNKNYKFNWGAWILGILGAFLFIFTVAWSVSSVIEGEPRAASMGMVVFGIPALIMLFLTRRLVVKSKKVAEN